MKKLALSILFQATVLTAIFSQDIHFQWTKSYIETGGENQIYPEFFAASAQHLFTSGSVLSSGNDFDPDTGIYNLSAPYNKNFHLSEFDLNGNHIWSRIIGCSKASQGAFRSTVKGIALDQDENLYVCGTFLDTLFFETSGGWQFAISKGYTDIFIGKIDTSGNFLWLKTYGGIYDDAAGAISVSENGEVYLCGSYSDSVRFIPGSTPHYAPVYEMFLLKFNALDEEQWVYSTNNPSTFPYFEVTSMTLDNKDGIYIGGQDFDFYGDYINFQSAGSTDLFYNNNEYDGFVTKIDTTGNYQWTKVYSSSDYDYIDNLAYNVATGNVVVSGRAGNDDIDFDTATSADTLSFPSYLLGNYLLNLSKTGEYKWMKLLFADNGGPTPLITKIKTDSKGNIHGFSTFASSIDVHPGTDTVIYSPSPGGASFSSYSILLDSTGEYLWSYQYKTAYNGDIAYGLGIDPFDNVYIGLFDGTGATADTLILGDQEIVHQQTARHIIQYRQCHQEIADTLVVSACNSYTSPSGNHAWNTSGIYKDTLVETGGCVSIITINLTINTVDTTVTTSNSTLTSHASTSSAYQWLDCNNGYTVIPGATGQSYTAITNGNYEVEITNNGCVDTSYCHTVTLGNNFSYEFVVSPNPTSGKITIKFGRPQESLHIRLFSVSGKLIETKNFRNTNLVQLELNKPNGIYLLEIANNNEEKAIVKLIKE